MQSNKDPRVAIKNELINGDLKRLLERAGQIHGHYCPPVALGVMATYIAFKRFGITDSTGMEEILAIVECNNCFVDGIQAVSGCTLGNNALIYKDFGKMAVTFIDRKNKRGVRLFAKYFGPKSSPDPEAEEAADLFERAVKNREKLSKEESDRMHELWTKMSFDILSKKEDEIFEIKDVDPEYVSYAPIFDSIECSVCGEKVMETRVRMKDNKPVCIPCAGTEYWMVAGRGIYPLERK